MPENSPTHIDVTDREREVPPSVITPPGSRTICNSLTAVYKRLLGRGPDNVRLWFIRPNTVIILLAGTLTTSERSLLDTGHAATVLAVRNVVHDLLEPELRVLIEQELHRKSNAFIAGTDVKRDVVSLVVTLS